MKELTPEEKLQKIIVCINENQADYISVNKLKDIIGIESTSKTRQSKLFMPGVVYKEYHESKEYKENYIS
ncbi:MAG: hypothetical protein IQL11_15675 [Bacteroidales bacterium]|nr:hypothetical protein [Bacteroidales bacterium]